MFELKKEEMKASIFIENSMYQTLTASNVGLGNSGIYPKCHCYSWDQAIEIINKIDLCLLSCPKYLYKRIRSTRMQFVFAFGPEMEDEVGYPPNR